MKQEQNAGMPLPRLPRKEHSGPSLDQECPNGQRAVKAGKPQARPNDSRRDHRDPLVSVPEGPSMQLMLNVSSLSLAVNTCYFVVDFRERERERH